MTSMAVSTTIVPISISSVLVSMLSSSSSLTTFARVISSSLFHPVGTEAGA